MSAERGKLKLEHGYGDSIEVTAECPECHFAMKIANWNMRCDNHQCENDKAYKPPSVELEEA